jgi:hypothetical protein
VFTYVISGFTYVKIIAPERGFVKDFHQINREVRVCRRQKKTREQLQALSGQGKIRNIWLKGL